MATDSPLMKHNGTIAALHPTLDQQYSLLTKHSGTMAAYHPMLLDQLHSICMKDFRKLS